MPRTFVPALFVCALVACDSETEEPPPIELPPSETVLAEQRLFAAMRDDDYGSSNAIVAELGDLQAAHPDDHRNTFLYGAANLWALAESVRAAPGEGPDFGEAIPAIQESFEAVAMAGGPDAAAATGF